MLIRITGTCSLISSSTLVLSFTVDSLIKSGQFEDAIQSWHGTRQLFSQWGSWSTSSESSDDASKKYRSFVSKII